VSCHKVGSNEQSCRFTRLSAEAANMEYFSKYNHRTLLLPCENILISHLGAHSQFPGPSYKCPRGIPHAYPVRDVI